MSTGAPPSSGSFECDARSYLLIILSGLSRFQWSVVRTTRRIAIASREEYVVSLPADALTADALQSWEECVQGLRHLLETESCGFKRQPENMLSKEQPTSCLSDLFQRDWFAAVMCPFLTTADACRMRAAAPGLSSCVVGYAWDDLICPIPFQYMHLWRKCFPHACGANVVLPALPHPSITSAVAGAAAVAPHDVIFEHFAGLRRLRVDGVKGYVISDAAFAHLSGIVELELPNWQDIDLLTDEGLQHLAGIRKLNFTNTCSLHISSEGFRHLAGIQSLQMAAVVYWDEDGTVVWQMMDEALFHLRGIRQLTLTDGYSRDIIRQAAEGITDAGFAHLRGIQELELAAHLQITALAFSHLAGIASLKVWDVARRGLISDETLAYFAGIKRLQLREAPLITDAGLRHLSGITKLQLSNCPLLTGSGFVHLSGIQQLGLVKCPSLTDTAFQYLRAIHVLGVQQCPSLTDAAFVHLAGIESLSIRNCSQHAISNKAFAHLAGIRSLELNDCTQSTITSDFLHHLPGIWHVSMAGCSVEIDTATFSKLRSLTSLRLVGAPLPTILAVLQAFQGNAAVEPGLWKALCGDTAVINIFSESPESDVLAPVYDLVSPTSLLPLLRAGLSKVDHTRVAVDAELVLLVPGGLQGPAAAVVLAARLLPHVARRGRVERSHLLTNAVVSMLLAYIGKQSWGSILFALCSALDFLCQFPEFAAQLLEQNGVAVLALVLSRAQVVPVVDLDTWPNHHVAAAVCRSLGWTLTHQPAAAGMVLADLDVMPLLCNFIGNGAASVSGSAAAALASALVRALAISRQQ